MIDDKQAHELRLTLFSSGWTQVMQPALRNRGMQATKALVLSRTERTAVFKGTDFDTEDDVLRAYIRDCEYLLVAFQNELTVWEHNRQGDELARQSTDPSAGANPR